jgi:hypothetical protein
MKRARQKHNAMFKAKVPVAAGVFEGGGTAVEGVAGAAQVDLLYRQIGQLKVENDFLARKARQMSRAERRALVERTGPALPISHQCRLLAVSRSSVYRRSVEVGEEDRTIMALIDRHYLARPYYGSRRMAAWLATQGQPGQPQSGSSGSCV